MSESIHEPGQVPTGEPRGASELLPLVYDELRKLAAARLAQEKPGHTLDPTALVHEAYLRMGHEQQFQHRGHFFAAAAEAMRRILVDQARRKQTDRHGGGRQREALDPSELISPLPADDLLALNEALELLAVKDPQKAELVKLRYFTGLSADQAAHILGISPSTADRYWTYSRAWLKRAMSDEVMS